VRLERGGRLVEDEEPRADCERTGDLDDLLLLDRELGDGLVDVEIEAPLEQQPPSLPADGGVRSGSTRSGSATAAIWTCCTRST